MRKIVKKELKVWSVTLAVAAVWLVMQLPVMESRWVRDVLALTPFYDVEVYSRRIEGNAMTITGGMKKRRCEREGPLLAYTLHNGVIRVAVIDTSPEHAATPASRAPDENVQFFGPWRILALHPNPDKAFIFVGHICPEGPTQNKFLEAEWSNL